MNITEETRREAYYESREDACTRRKLVYQALKDAGPMTVDELVGHLILAGYMRVYDRNYVAPRLTELKRDGLVETNGTRESARSGKKTAVWQAVEAGNEKAALRAANTEDGDRGNNSDESIPQEGRCCQ